MTEKTLNGIFKLRGDTLSNWSTNNPTLAEREMAIVVVPANSGTGLNEPAVLLKVGDGETAFNSLAFVSAIAADVSPWAKAATKPTYNANEIVDLDEYISGEIQDTNTTYKLEQDTNNGRVLKLSYKNVGDSSWTLADTVTIPDYDDTALAGRVTSLESALADKQAKITATGILKGDGAGGVTAATAGTDYQAPLPSQSGNSGKFLTTNGSAMSWATVDALPSQSGNSGKFLTTNGTTASWSAVPEVSVSKKATANTGYISSYQVTVDGSPVGVDIDIPKDYLVKSASVGTVSTANTPYTGAAVGDKYIDFVINTRDSSGSTGDEHLYIPVNDLMAAISAGNGINISSANAISIKIDSTNANGLATTSSGLKLGLASGSAAGAMSSSDYTKLSGVSTGANKVEASNTNGNIKIDNVETTVYSLPSTVLHSTDTFIFDGGTASSS